MTSVSRFSFILLLFWRQFEYLTCFRDISAPIFPHLTDSAAICWVKEKQFDLLDHNDFSHTTACIGERITGNHLEREKAREKERHWYDESDSMECEMIFNEQLNCICIEFFVFYIWQWVKIFPLHSDLYDDGKRGRRQSDKRQVNDDTTTFKVN